MTDTATIAETRELVERDIDALTKAFATAIDSQVIVAAIQDAGGYGDNPYWLWRSHQSNVTGFGRWSKGQGQAPYIRADIAIAAAENLSRRLTASLAAEREAREIAERERDEANAKRDEFCNEMHIAGARAEAAEAEIARREQAVADGVPIGWKLVPEVPTEEQMSAGLYQASHDADYADVCQSYMDMVKVAPEPPAIRARSKEATDAR